MIQVLRTKKLDWDSSWTPEDYSFYSLYGDPENKPVGIHFMCPGCGAVISIEIGKVSPKWAINFETLTATPSILHTKPDGCGWHGYLTNGELKGQIE